MYMKNKLSTGHLYSPIQSVETLLRFENIIINSVDILIKKYTMAGVHSFLIWFNMIMI
jgi:hypothetical protein